MQEPSARRGMHCQHEMSPADSIQGCWATKTSSACKLVPNEGSSASVVPEIRQQGNKRTAHVASQSWNTRAPSITQPVCGSGASLRHAGAIMPRWAGQASNCQATHWLCRGKSKSVLSCGWGCAHPSGAPHRNRGSKRRRNEHTRGGSYLALGGGQDCCAGNCSSQR